jgi:hypothetical protein
MALGECCTRTAVVLIAQACEVGLTLLVPRSLVGKPGVEAAAPKPQEDGSGGRPASSLLVGASGSGLLAGASGLLVEELLATALVLLVGASGLLVEELLSTTLDMAGMSGVFIEELLATALVLLAGASGLLVEELLSTTLVLAGASGVLVEELLATALVLLAGTSGLLVEELLLTALVVAGVSGMLVKELLAMALVLPQAVDDPLPIPVGAFRAGMGPMKNGSPQRGRRQQPGGLLVFAECTLVPFLPWKGGTNVGRGVVCLIVGKHPAGGPGGRLRPLDAQPLFMIREEGRGQMSRR